MKRLIPLILTVLCVAGCRSNAQERHLGSLAELPIFTQFARGFELLELLEGLPHQAFEKEALKKEINEKDAMKLNGYWFYEELLEIQAKDEEELRSILSDNSSYAPYSGIKRCGGFHPDYGVKLLNKSEAVYFYICFGCGEIKAYRGKKELHADLSNVSSKRLKELLKPYGQNRPNIN